MAPRKPYEWSDPKHRAEARARMLEVKRKQATGEIPRGKSTGRASKPPAVPSRFIALLEHEVEDYSPTLAAHNEFCREAHNAGIRASAVAALDAHGGRDLLYQVLKDLHAAHVLPDHAYVKHGEVEEFYVEGNRGKKRVMEEHPEINLSPRYLSEADVRKFTVAQMIQALRLSLPLLNLRLQPGRRGIVEEVKIYLQDCETLRIVAPHLEDGESVDLGRTPEGTIDLIASILAERIGADLKELLLDEAPMASDGADGDADDDPPGAVDPTITTGTNGDGDVESIGPPIMH
jgi:hypothetical protein